jgi:hypothetical protein
MQKPFLALISLFCISLMMVSAFAGGPVFWRLSTRAEIEKGDAQGVSIADNGALTLAPAFTEVFDTRQAYIWSVAADAAGNVYLGTGHEGRIFKVDPTGKGTLFYKTGELDVMALAVDTRNNLYAGTSPDGKIYRITPQGEAKVFFEPKTKYIWALVFDHQGRLLVGTGDKGVIYRVTADGQGAPLVDTTQTNITALGIDEAGNIIAGTDPDGLVLRITPEGKVFTLFDSAQREVRDLAIGGQGEIYAITLSEAAGSGATNTAAASSAPTVASAEEGVTVTISEVQVVETAPPTASSSTSASSRTSGEQAKSALYRLAPHGESDVLWDSRDVVAFAVALESDGRILVGTGQKGRILGISANGKHSLLVQSLEAQTSRFVRAGKQLYAASSNLGKLYRLGSETVASGIYTSPVHDAQVTASWGRISWVGEGDLELQTRSGNTATPDATWSDWSAPYRQAEGEAITSPRARYLQWRATLKRSNQMLSPRLREVTISYLPRNLAPSITSIRALPVGVALQALPQPQADGGAEQAGVDPQTLGVVVQVPPRRVFQRGAVSLQWQAEDRNKDTLEYAVYYREASSSDYYPLKTNLRENYYTIEANALPDGKYVFKVVASDAPSNPRELALTDELETEPMEIDNTPPVVTAEPPRLEGNQLEVLFRASDATSIIRRAEYQLDGGEWRSVFPVDGIADSRREDFRVKVTLPDSRAHVLAFRVFDANANVGSAQVAIRARN